jgi:hypothetical protein
MILSIRAYVEAGAALVLVAALWWFGFHEREVGKTVIEREDTAATAKVQARADEETEANAIKAAIAAEGAAHDQRHVDQYAAAHPIEPVRVCHPDGGSGSVSQARTVAGGVTNSLPGPGSFSAVPERPAGPDISEGLTELVLAASRLAVIDAERQQR